MLERIIGKYEVLDSSKPDHPHSIITDNPLEAVWEANKSQDRTIINRCGEKKFRKSGGKWKIVR